jgi:hypothetical protein
MLSVNPKGHMAGDPSDNHPKSRNWHPYSDKMLEASIRRSDSKFSLRKELARHDRTKRALETAKKKGKVIYG